MKKIKTIFPSRNYITIDTYGDVDVIFNPVGDGTEGEDKLTFRRGRWAFRINDFLSGKTLSNGEQEQMNRKVYNVNLVYDDEDGEPQVTTTYVDPTSVVPLDGSIVVVEDLGKLGKESTLQTLGKESTLQTLGKESTLQKLKDSIEDLKSSVNDITASLGKVSGMKRIKKWKNVDTSKVYPAGTFFIDSVDSNLRYVSNTCTYFAGAWVGNFTGGNIVSGIAGTYFRVNLSLYAVLEDA